MSFMLSFLGIVEAHEVLVFNDILMIQFNPNLEFLKLFFDVFDGFLVVAHIVCHFVDEVAF